MIGAIARLLRSFLGPVHLRWRRLLGSQTGSFSITTALLLTTLMIAAGCAVDFARLVSARSTAEGLADAAVLAAAASEAKDPVALQAISETYLKSIQAAGTENLRITGYDYDTAKRSITLHASGVIPTTFMSIASISTMEYSIVAQATRTPPETVELVMVLDNTWSMNGLKLMALKKAALSMVDVLERANKTGLKIGSCPMPITSMSASAIAVSRG